MKKSIFILLSLFMIVSSCTNPDQNKIFGVTHLQVEHLTNPLAICEKQPNFSWRLQVQGDNVLQEAYSIEVSTGAEEIWKTGKIESGKSVNIQYEGPALESNKTYTWKVSVFASNGKKYTSETARFETGLLVVADWKGKWIGKPTKKDSLKYKLDQLYWIWYPEPNSEGAVPKGKRFFRKQYSIPPIEDIQEAFFIFSGDDKVSLFINGKKAGKSQWLKNNEVNVLEHLKTGNNFFELEVFNQWGTAGVIGQLYIKNKEGKNIYLSTDDTWLTSKNKTTWGKAKIIAKVGEGKGREWLNENMFIPPKIEPAAYLRKPFELDKTVKEARLYATALGVYNIYMNGTKVGNAHLAPGWSDYNDRVLYQAYDVTSHLQNGKNTIGAILGDGWYAGTIGWGHMRNHYGTYPLYFLAQLKITYHDGTEKIITTDNSWKSSTGPILVSDFLDGEIYDFNKEMPGWCKNEFDDSGWEPVVTKNIGENIMAHPGPPMKIVKKLKPIEIMEPKKGTYVVDMGQNLVGWIKMRVTGAKGDTITIGHAEMLNEDSTIYTENLRSAIAVDQFILKDGEQTLEPHFTFHGFRYISISGCKTKPAPDDITGMVLQSNTPRTGHFECSNELINKIYHNALWGQMGNFISVPTDCPQRDERLGWMGDAQVFVKTACYNMDVCPFFNKWMYDVVDAQAKDGGFSNVSPRLVATQNGAPAWGDAGIIVPWTVFQFYDNKAILTKHYDHYVAWVEYIKKNNPGLLWKNNRDGDYGDWLNTDAVTDKEVLATAFFAYSTNLLAKIAETLDKTEDAEKYRNLFEKIAEAFVNEYVDEDGKIRGHTQTAYVLALKFELLPEEMQEKAVKHLVDLIKEHDMHHSTGFVGIGHLLPTLTKYGHNNIAWQLISNNTFPSLGYMVENGATTIWERWDGWTHNKGFQNAGMNSFNHYSLGSPVEWLYTHALGITPASPGFKKIHIQPWPDNDIKWAKGSVETVYGKITCHWKTEGEQFTVTIEIPDNTSAEIHLPCTDVQAPVETEKSDSKFSISKVGSGKYTFTGKLNKEIIK